MAHRCIGTGTSYRCADPSSHGRSKTLFVIVSFLPDERNRAIFVRTLQSVRCFHPHDPVLVVDNASPGDNVALAVADALRGSAINGSSRAVRVTRRERSLAILTAWAAADDVLNEWPPSAEWGEGMERIVFLQHSTRLCRPMPSKFKQGCAAVALSGQWTMTGFRRSHFRARLPWVSMLAETVGIACSSPCERRGLQCGAQQRCWDWGSLTHWTAAFTREGWERLASLQLWPRREGAPWALAREAQEFILNASHPWRNITDGTYQFATQTEWIVGFERLTGIIAAAINAANGKTWNSCCAMGHSCDVSVNVVGNFANAPLLEKQHGATHY
jgi:hypothetical protein